MKKYDAKYFIAKFEKIPDSKWCTGSFNKGGQSCAFGHCGANLSFYPTEARALSRLFSKLRDEYGLTCTDINDMEYRHYPLGDTPKERIVNALLMIDSGMLEDV